MLSFETSVESNFEIGTITNPCATYYRREWTAVTSVTRKAGCTRGVRSVGTPWDAHVCEEL